VRFNGRRSLSQLVYNGLCIVAGLRFEAHGFSGVH
jgi:hypothetical protein